MNVTKFLFAVQLMLHLASASSWNYSYATNGSDWYLLDPPLGEVNDCGADN